MYTWPYKGYWISIGVEYSEQHKKFKYIITVDGVYILDCDTEGTAERLSRKFVDTLKKKNYKQQRGLTINI